MWFVSFVVKKFITTKSTKVTKFVIHRQRIFLFFLGALGALLRDALSLALSRKRERVGGEGRAKR